MQLSLYLYYLVITTETKPTETQKTRQSLLTSWVLFDNCVPSSYFESVGLLVLTASNQIVRKFEMFVRSLGFSL